MTLSHGTRLGPYEVLAPVGIGGMGEVYRARDSRLGRDVALKVLQASPASEVNQSERLLREARAAAALNHPNICAVYDVGDHQGVPFFVMELLEGHALDRQIAQQPLPIHDVVRIGTQLAFALEAAHGKGIIHRDIKPSNIFITVGGTAKVLDFGIANLLPPSEQSAATALTNDPALAAGTLPYMAPEQLRGGAVDVRTDIYASGVVLYEMTTGQRPFREQTPLRLMDAILHGTPAALHLWRHDVPPALEELISSCLERDPARRCQSALELATRLQELSTTGAGHRLPAVRPSTTRRRIKRKPIRSLAVLPLRNISAEAAEDYLVDGMTEALITELAKIGALKVISRNSAMRYKSHSQVIRDIAQQLNVDAVVEGSVLRVGGRVRISAQLIHAATDEHVWAESYDRDFADVLSLQQEIAQAIAHEIRLAVSPGDRGHLVKMRTVAPEVHEAYLKGRFHWNRRTPDALRRAIAFFTTAVEHDPNFALAYTGLADCYVLGGDGLLSRQESMARAKAMAVKALSLDEAGAEAHASLASVAFRWEWDWLSAEREFKRAIAISPGHSATRHSFAFFLTAMARFPEALTQIRRAQELDPLSVLVGVGAGRVLDLARRHDEAIAEYHRALDTDPQFAEAHFDLAMAYRHKHLYAEAAESAERAVEIGGGSPAYFAELGHTYGLMGRRADAVRILDHLQDLSTRAYIAPTSVAWVFLGLGDVDAVFSWLDRAYQERSGELVYFAVEPDLDPLSADPRLSDLLRRIGLPSA